LTFYFYEVAIYRLSFLIAECGYLISDFGLRIYGIASGFAFGYDPTGRSII